MKTREVNALGTDELRSLGRRLVDASAEPSQFEQEARFRAMEQALALAPFPVEPGPLSFRRYGAWVAAAVLVASVAVAVIMRQNDADLSFSVKGGEVAQGQYVRATSPALATELLFSEGTHIAFSANTRGRVLDVSPHGAAFLVEDGHVALSVVPSPAGRWSVAAGPFLVEVTGTEFSVDWDAREERLQVEVIRGSIRVQGPDADGVRVRAGQRFRAWFGQGRHSLEPLVEAANQDAAASSKAPVEEYVAQALPADEGPNVDGVKPSNGAPSWEQRISQAQYADVVADAERRGIQAVLATARRGELMALADAARYLKKGALAEQALRAVRARFRGSEDAAAAAFLLGRLAEGRDSAEAQALYAAASREDANGPFRAEILGRRMLLSQKLGRRSDAVAFAKSYLKLTSDGPYAEKARDILKP